MSVKIKGVHQVDAHQAFWILAVGLVIAMMTSALSWASVGNLAMTQISNAQTAEPKPIATTAPAEVEVKQLDLNAEKLRLEIEKLKYETRSDWRRPATWLSGVTTLITIAAFLVAAIYSTAKHELARAEARMAQADAREAGERLRESEAQLVVVKSQLVDAEKRLADQLQESSRLAQQIAAASASLGRIRGQGESSEFDISSPEMQALLSLGAAIVVNDSMDPVEIGINTVSRLTSYGHYERPDGPAEIVSDDVKYLSPVAAKQFATIGGVSEPSSGLMYARSFQVRARPVGRPNEVTPVIDVGDLHRVALRYTGRSLEIINAFADR